MSEVPALNDMKSLAQVVLTQAMEYCAEKARIESVKAVKDHLRAGDGKACEYCHYSVGKQVAESMGSLDENIKAVYICDYDATPGDLCFGVATQPLPIHLIVWAQPKTAALHALADTWNHALSRSYAEIIGESQLAHVLDVQVVDDAEVERRIGYGALLSSIHNRPIQVWKR